MTLLEKKLSSALRRFSIGPMEMLVVAVSGGADSCSLLDALARLKSRARPTLHVAHFNHGLRGQESDQDEEFVTSKTAALSLPISTERKNLLAILQQTGGNLEATARHARYEFLQRTAEKIGAAYVLTAHTQNDQAETILMRLLRGSGSTGLRGIRASRPLGHAVTLLRPLLDVTREEVLDYCGEYGVEYRTDSSNLSPDRLRNRVRAELLPLLRTFNPKSDEALIRSATIITEEDLFLEQYAIGLMRSLQETPKEIETPALRIKPMQALAPPIRNRILRCWIKSVRGDLSRIDSTHLAAINRLLMTGQSGRVVELPAFWVVFREFDLLKLELRTTAPSALAEPVRLSAGRPQPFGDFEIELSRGINATQLPPNEEHALILESELLDRLEIRRRQPGDAYVPANGHQIVKLKTLMIRAKIPLSMRDSYPIVVSSEGHILWSPGLPIAQEFSPPPGEHECALITARKRRKE